MTLPAEIGAVLDGRSEGCVQAPFPWFGGKRQVAGLVWERFGDVQNYVEPFFGSGAVLLNRPGDHENTLETVNDKDGYIANFWRAVQRDPDAVAFHADHPVNENDLHARHSWLLGQRDTLVSRLEGNPDFYDAKIAGWWCWGICCWIGHGFCSGSGPWQVVDGQLVHLGNKGQGVNRKRVHLGNKGQDGEPETRGIYGWFQELADRLRYVRVCCGDWSRVCGPTPTVKQGLTGVFLDPPYAVEDRSDCYNVEDRDVAHAVREWAIQWGDDARMRIALCGYEGEHQMPDSWGCVPWKARGGFASQSKQHDNPNARRERVWFSPHCLVPVREQRAGQMALFGEGAKK